MIDTRIILYSLLILSTTLFCTQQLSAQSCSDGSYQFSDMVSIFESNSCTGCHGGSGGLNLSNYTNVVNGGTNGAGGCGPYPNALSFLIGKIDGSLTSGDGCGSAMPRNIVTFGTPGMSPSDIAAIQTWINAGAPEFCPTSCPATLNITGVIPSGGQNAAQNIISTGTLNSGVNATFQSPCIELLPGFEGVLGAILDAKYGTCQ